jgi:phosphoribosyl 1,2-cyclic phosphodiesterase/FixJ family two-component response regulator
VRIQFWGTRGSIAKPGPSTARYGGNTACVEIRSARGTLVIIDCGTGGHPLGQKLMAAGAEGVCGHILISHTHWDHIQGIPFFAPLFAPGNDWNVYGPKGLGQSLRDTLTGQMQYTYFPITLDQCAARIRYHDLVEGAFEIEDVKVYTQYLNHPALTLGYRLEADGVAVVYCSDHEPYSRELATGAGEITGQDLRHAEFIDRADLVIHDAQYTAEEYQTKVGWGHSSFEYVMRLCQFADVKRVALTHHDPLRDDDALDRLLTRVRAQVRETGSSLDIFAAAEGHVVEVVPSAVMRSPRRAGRFRAETRIEPALDECSILLSMADVRTAAALSEAIRDEGMRVSSFSDAQEAQGLIAKDRPALAILEHDPPGIDGMSTCRAIRADESNHKYQVPVIMVAAQEDQAAAAAAGVTDWLVRPFSDAYARTKIRAWVFRSTCQWMRGAIPADEERRLASLRALSILDTAPEERFDRITRLASALFDAPIALVSLIDEDRQWFKSCYGTDVKQTSRDAAFCSHVVHAREPMIVPDTFLDPRFADNPFVVNEPRIRFYAGFPLILDDGACIGSLCVVDTRPRSPDAADLARLRDLAELAVQEIRGMAASAQSRPQLDQPPGDER